MPKVQRFRTHHARVKHEHAAPAARTAAADAVRTPGRRASICWWCRRWSSPARKVLDVGCGDGELLKILTETKNVDGRGIEISREGVNLCVAKGLAVIQGDADTDLADYPDDAFDYVILSQTLQATWQPRVVLEHMLRIGSRAIVSFPNFGHWKIRLKLLFVGRMPRTAESAGHLVRHAEHPFLHDPRFSRTV